MMTMEYSILSPDTLRAIATGHHTQFPHLDGTRHILRAEWQGKGSFAVSSVEGDAARKTLESLPEFAAALATAQGTGTVLERWTHFDFDECVFILVVYGPLTQVTSTEKPWLCDAETGKLPHEHCSCGIRVGASAAHDEIHAAHQLRNNVRGGVAMFFGRLLTERAAPQFLKFVEELASEALSFMRQMTPPPPLKVQRAVELATLTHVLDGNPARRAKDGGKEAADIAHKLLTAYEAPEEVAEEVARIIRLCKGTALPPYYQKELADLATGELLPENTEEDFVLEGEGCDAYFLPRHVNWMRSFGVRGAAAVLRELKGDGVPVVAADTPRATTPREVIDLATPDRYEAYKKGSLNPVSVIDYVYDVMLQGVDELLCHPIRAIRKKTNERLAPFIELCLAVAKGPETCEKVAELILAQDAGLAPPDLKEAKRMVSMMTGIVEEELGDAGGSPGEGGGGAKGEPE